MNALLRISLFLILSGNAAYAQKGIRFDTTHSWEQIQAKARAEKKYIFVDAYTTWCVPCRQMARDIFPKAEVGEFFNANFINVAVQFDQNKADKPVTKSWYKDVNKLKDTYHIESYPTYLFFDPDGNLVHSIAGSSATAAEFLTKSKQALDPKTQYVQLKKIYESGRRDSAFMSGFIKVASRSADRALVPVYIREYLATRTDLLNPENLMLILQAKTKSSDKWFTLLLNERAKVDAVIGSAYRFQLISNIAYDEVIFPKLRLKGVKKDLGGGMSIYTGTPVSDVDWGKIEAQLNPDYGNLSHDIILAVKPSHFIELKDWTNAIAAVNAYIAESKNLSNDKLSTFAEMVFSDSDDPNCIRNAVDWAALTIKRSDQKVKGYYQTLARLQYKAGDKVTALANMNIYAQSVEFDKEDVLSEIEKMKKGEKTW